jgi:hypothetical protein
VARLRMRIELLDCDLAGMRPRSPERLMPPSRSAATCASVCNVSRTTETATNGQGPRETEHLVLSGA